MILQHLKVEKNVKKEFKSRGNASGVTQKAKGRVASYTSPPPLPPLILDKAVNFSAHST